MPTLLGIKAPCTPGPGLSTWDGVPVPSTQGGDPVLLAVVPGTPPHPRQPPHNSFLLFFQQKDAPGTRSPCPLPGSRLWGPWPSGCFLPSLPGPAQSPRSPLASRQPHALPVAGGQAGRVWGPLPELQALWPVPLRLPASGCAAQLQELSCSTRAQHRAEVQCGMRGARPSRRGPWFCRRQKSHLSWAPPAHPPCPLCPETP